MEFLIVAVSALAAIVAAHDVSLFYILMFDISLFLYVIDQWHSAIRLAIFISTLFEHNTCTNDFRLHIRQQLIQSVLSSSSSISSFSEQAGIAINKGEEKKVYPQFIKKDSDDDEDDKVSTKQVIDLSQYSSVSYWFFTLLRLHTTTIYE